MVVSLWSDGAVALAAALRSRPECRTPGVPTSALGLAPVYLGPQWMHTEDPADCLVVAYAEDDEVAGTFDQVPHSMSPQRRRQESGVIRCLSSAQSGDLDPTVVLDRAFALLEVVDATIRTIATAQTDLGLQASVPVIFAQFELGGTGAVRWSETKVGPRCNVEFAVTYTAHV